MRNLKPTIKLVTYLLLSACAVAVMSCNKDKGVTPTIAQVAVSMKGFSQLEAAVIKGDLVVALSNMNTAANSDGNFTVFAPTNQAFAKIGLANPQDFNALKLAFLKNVLNYHTSNGNTKIASLTPGAGISSLLGPAKRIIIRGGEMYVNGAKIISADIKAENGTLHAIDRVLLASGLDVAKTASFFAEGKGFINPELTFLNAAVNYADLSSTLADPSAKYTVFAPTDQAFRELGALINVALNQASDIQKLPKETVKQILLCHVFSMPGGEKFTSELYPGQIAALNNQSITLGAYENSILTVKAGGNTTVANMVIPDVQCNNGVIHIIDRVLLPQ